MLPSVSRGIMKKKKWKIVNPNILFALRPVPHGEGISVPEPTKEFTINSDDEDEGKSTSGSSEPPESPNHTSPTVGLLHHSHAFSHRTKLNHLVCDLELSKGKAELPVSRLKQWILLEENIRISCFLNRHQQLVPFLRKKVDLVFCYGVDGVMNAL
jgi:hypothetical protein